MTNEEKKQLLFTAMCGYLPYGLMVDYPLSDTKRGVERLTGISEDGLVTLDILSDFPVFDIVKDGLVPYLRPMTSMTAEEICKIENIIGDEFTYRDGTLTLNTEEIIRIPIYKISDLIQFMYSRHLDFNNLIPMGLALEAPEGMYEIK